MDHFHIGDGSLTPWTPIDQSLITVDVALIIESDECFAHCKGETVVKREAFAPPIR